MENHFIAKQKGRSVLGLVVPEKVADRLSHKHYEVEPAAYCVVPQAFSSACRLDDVRARVTRFRSSLVKGVSSD